MNDVNRISKWSRQLGLAEVPLFGGAQQEAEPHAVLLDGGRGSFALSVRDNVTEIEPNWIWSADLPHHVVVSGNKVLVGRWDDAHSNHLSLDSVENRLEEFYRFLFLDRVKSQRTVVDHFVDMFRRLRSVLYNHNYPDSFAIELFLIQLAAMASDSGVESLADPDAVISTTHVGADTAGAVHELSQRLIAIAQDFSYSHSTYFSGTPHTDLAIRHAGGAIFQEAHFELVRAGPSDLFGSADVAQVKIDTRGGVHFTPPALARIIAEDVIGVLSANGTLTIFDPACGSGSFLYEAVRAIGRDGKIQKVRLIGRDISPHAISMAWFVLEHARRDWPRIDITIDLKAGNSLQEKEIWKDADAILMNPPFVSWSAMNTEQRDETKRILGSDGGGKPDYCMAFVDLAASLTKPGCVIGTLLPASLLSVRTSERWRSALAEKVVFHVISAFGDHGLFRFALVQVGAMVFQTQNESVQRRPQRMRSLWVGSTPSATGNALRALRKLRPNYHNDSSEEWTLTVTSPVRIQKLPDWRPRPQRLRKILARVEENMDTTVADVFSVSEGARAGDRESFVLSAQEYATLSKEERKFFRPIAEGRNLRLGQISKSAYLFYPESEGLPKIDNEEYLADLLPMYYEKWLNPARDRLANRVAIRRRTKKNSSPRWWELNWSRPWQFDYRMKIVSAYFGERGSFGLDESGEYVVLQGHAWLPRGTARRPQKGGVETGWSMSLHRAFTALLNSRPFEQLLIEFCPRVAGGQVELSKRFVDRIPLPDLSGLMQRDAEITRTIEQLADLQPEQFSDIEKGWEVDRAVATLYGVTFEEWPAKPK